MALGLGHPHPWMTNSQKSLGVLPQFSWPEWFWESNHSYCHLPGREQHCTKCPQPSGTSACPTETRKEHRNSPPVSQASALNSSYRWDRQPVPPDPARHGQARPQSSWDGLGLRLGLELARIDIARLISLTQFPHLLFWPPQNPLGTGKLRVHKEDSFAQSLSADSTKDFPGQKAKMD